MNINDNPLSTVNVRQSSFISASAMALGEGLDVDNYLLP